MNKEDRCIAFDSASMRTVDANGFLHVERSPLTRVQVAPYLGREISGWLKDWILKQSITHTDRRKNLQAKKQSNR